MALFEIQSFKDSLETFRKHVLDPIIKKISRIEEKLLSDTHTPQETPEEMYTTHTLPEDKVSVEDQSSDKEDDIQRFIIDGNPDPDDQTNMGEGEQTRVDGDKEAGSDKDEEFYLEDDIKDDVS